MVIGMKIEDLDWSVRTYNCIKHYGIDTVEQLSAMTDEDLMKIRNLGQKNFMEIKQKLNELQITENKCWLCDDLDKIYEMVCYIPTDNGGAIDVPVIFCPKCGKKINW